jgi:Ca2+-binding RTX toxin-like protein
MAEIIGTDDADYILGLDEADVIDGGAGADTLIGGAGADVLHGGAGMDLFVINERDSLASDAVGADDPAAVIDVIDDWGSDDRLLFAGAATPQFGSLYPGVAGDYDAAYDMAQAAFANGFEYASIKVGSDIFVFAPRTDSVVELRGVEGIEISTASLSGGTAEFGLTETGGGGDEDRVFTIGADFYDGGSGDDTIQGAEGADTLLGAQGDDQIWGGQDNDQLDGGDGANYLRGQEGDDAVSGGAQHDDINGNTGADTLTAGAGDDWVRGGKGNDVVFGGEGADLVFGDLGSDTCGGGTGDDSVQGGLGDDVLRGDDGDDTLLGDAGDDTLDGGLGADVFVATADGGHDRVLFFNADEGDRVQLSAGLDYHLSQVGDDTVIDLLDGGQMVLAGVHLASLPQGWLITA